ncbi:trehalose-phosphatase [Chloroflexota bacterium]
MAPYTFNYLDSIEAALRQSPFGLLTDVDGTISPTAPTPQQAKVSPLCRHYLATLCQQLALVAAISGRPAAQIKEMINIDGLVYIGNHGLERWADGHPELTKDARSYLAVIKTAIGELSPLLSIEGIIIENKGVTATIHYRCCPDPNSAEKHILAAVKNSPQAKKLKIIAGRMAINLLPPVTGNKGTATLSLIQEYHLQSGVYLGDDVTDIDAFRAIHTASRDSNFQGFAIGITSEETPERLTEEADFTLNGVSDVERFLKWMSQTASQLG